MIISPHVALGSYLGSRAASTPRAFAAGFLSHYLLDAVPHRDYQINQRKLLMADFLLAFSLVDFNKKSLAGALGAISPDLIELALPRKGAVSSLHHYCHSTKQVTEHQSLLIQSATISLAKFLSKVSNAAGR